MDSEERQARAAAKRERAKRLGERVRLLRTWRGYTQDELAERAGLSRQLLSELEQGKRVRSRPQTLETLALALGVALEQLLGTQAIPELTVEVPPPDPDDPDDPPSRDYLTALGLLPALPPGTTLVQRRYPDGSTEVHLHIPGPCEGGGRNPPATGRG